jgi:GntR family transcriptional repressor for pyruvate dehydrogenase complex
MPSYKLSELLHYLASIPDDGDRRIPPLSELSKQLGISVASLREQLEAARLLGIVEIKPKAGIHKSDYSLRPALTASLTYAVETNSTLFTHLSNLRKHLEAAYFVEAVQLLSTNDIDNLSNLTKKAQEKIRSIPPQLPNIEHRELHLGIYKRLHNPFVLSILEVYWDLYKSTGLEIYTEVTYIDRVWQYHQRIVDAIKQGNLNLGQQILVEHMDLISQRERIAPRLSFE